MEQLKVCIVVPTYNESQNIKKLLDTIFQQTLGIEIKILVVDDSSPDGTADIVKEYAKKDLRIHLLLRKEKNGLGAAYIAGMQHALETIKPDILFEMDADFSHKPEYLVPMIAEIKAGSDFVIGSRYIPGGKIPDNWGVRRVIMSKGANLLSRLAISNRSIKDCTGGFRAIRATTLAKIDFNSLHVKGYAFQISLLEAIIQTGAIVKEIPISFVDRTEGESKLGMKDIFELLKVLAKIWQSKLSAVKRRQVELTPHV